ncbi:hypothetical protein PENTCL1PPCAC_12680 [Pristionchus entomophagus]|uniref:SLC41A/MgtE integral membrane domain-containing protein n=1 Tax=Pristionchus entomophagus TaxID=358040 RepID=A0AAV5T5X2_9BILA|nr:hypothetical protein PENTCL1PPCAC_12680 [Pristionchus entomophagus]
MMLCFLEVSSFPSPPLIFPSFSFSFSFSLYLTIISATIAALNDLPRDVLIHGWYAVIEAMIISCSSGEIFKKSVGIAVFQPLVNGIGGNIVTVQASRISTSLHQGIKLKRGISHFCSARRAFFTRETDSSATRVLLLLSLFSHSIFSTIIFLLPFPSPP